MDWVVAAPFFENADDRWITSFVTDGRHSFRLQPRFGTDRNWHDGAARAGRREWWDRMRQARQAFRSPDNGVITVFPQLAATAGLCKLSERGSRPLIAWLFNTEGLNASVKRAGARVLLGQVDRFVVHSQAEVAGYARLLRLPEHRFEFVPLQVGADVEHEAPAGRPDPYVFATGSGYRDYATFFDAVERLGLPTVVLASDRALRGVSAPANVEIVESLPRREIRRLIRHARVNVVPLTDQALTAGLVTIVETFRHGRSLVTTRRPGIEDYCRHEETALCAELFDASSMADAIDRMWSDEPTRSRLDRSASAFADANCTDEVAARHLVRVLDAVAHD